jgi:hypothetical protein
MEHIAANSTSRNWIVGNLKAEIRYLKLKMDGQNRAPPKMETAKTGHGQNWIHVCNTFRCKLFPTKLGEKNSFQCL